MTLSIALKSTKTGYEVDTSDMGLTGLQFTFTGTDFVKGTQSIGTTAELIGKGEITTAGFLVVKNLDATNYVEIAAATFATTAGTVKLKAGEVALFRSSSATPYACANTGACIIRYLFLED